MGKLQRVSKSKYRTVISDVLPYERPVFFTNRYFARFLKFYGIKSQGGMLVATRNMDTEGLREFLNVLGGMPGMQRPCFQYNITKEGHSEGRCLSIIHPYHQVRMLEFYERYKMLLIDFCQRSHFSIRFPSKIATYQKPQRGYHKMFSNDTTSIDTNENLKHYFSYKYYKNINFFYGDYRYLRAEKQFRRMVKMDLSSCFESIEPAMLSKAMFGHSMEQCNGSMAFDFCKLQLDFLNKENGIIIGPEFSRIYAEIVLQRIDQNVEQDLMKSGLIRNVDYIFYRYVDDGFLFYDTDNVKKLFLSVYIKRLGEYGLHVNDKKYIFFKTHPFLEDISIVKSHLLKLVDEKFQSRLDTFKGFVKMQNSQIDTPTKIDYKSFVNEVRIILQGGGTEVRYKDITSFLLGIIQKRTIALLSAFYMLHIDYCRAYESGDISERGIKIKERFEYEFIEFCLELTEILFFLLCNDMRMSTSIKVVSIINKLQMFVRGRYDVSDYEKSMRFPIQAMETLDDKISDEITKMFHHVHPCAFNTMEILNILELEKVMSKKNQIMPNVLNNFLSKIKGFEDNMNFFTVFEVMHFIKDDHRYDDIKEALYNWIGDKISTLANPDVSDTEAVLTFMETMSCPWVDAIFKKKFAKILFGNTAHLICRFAEKQKDLFVQWRNFNLNTAMLHVNSSEVY